MKFTQLFCAAAAIVMVGCNENAREASPKLAPLTEVTAVLEGSASTLDPVSIIDVHSQFVANAIHSPLSFVAQDGSLKLILAQSLEMGTDARFCRIALRPNAKFWDGSPVLAKDVKWSFERLRRSSHVHQWIFDLVEGVSEFDARQASGISGIREIDDRTIEIHFSKPEPEFLWFISSLATAITKSGSDELERRPYDTHIVGAGPFKPSAIHDNRSFTFERNAGFPLSNHLERIELKVLENPQNQLEAQRRGEVQITRLRGSMIQEACETKDQGVAVRSAFKGSQIVAARANEVLFLYFNWNSPALSGVSESDRKAMLQLVSATVDRKRAATQLYANLAIPNQTIASPQIYKGVHASSPELTDSFKASLKLTLYSSNDAPSRAVATYISNQTSASNVRLEAQFLEPGTLVKNVLSKDFEVALLWIELQIPSKTPYPWLSFFSQGTPFTAFGQALPEMTDSFRAVRSIVSDSARDKEIAVLLEQIVKTQTAWVPLLSRDAVFLVDPRAGSLFLDYNATPIIGLLGITE